MYFRSTDTVPDSRKTTSPAGVFWVCSSLVPVIRNVHGMNWVACENVRAAVSTYVPFGGGAMTRSRNSLLGVVLVAPETLPREDLLDVEQVLDRATRVRLVGVIAYRRTKPEARAASAGGQR